MATWTLGVWCAIGMVIAVAVVRRSERSRMSAELVRTPLYVALWPLFLPTLLPHTVPASTPARTRFDPRIEAAEVTLANALRGLGRELDDPMAIEGTRVAALGASMRAAAQRIQNLEAALALPMHDLPTLEKEIAAARLRSADAELIRVLERRIATVERLRLIRQQASQDLERALAETTELASRLTLLRYEQLGATGGISPTAVRARELTDTVDDLCRVLTEARAE